MAINIDQAFVNTWHPIYDEVADDEREYLRLVGTVSRDMRSGGTIAWATFYDIWKWFKAVRRIDLVKRNQFDTTCAQAFRRAASAPPGDKLAQLVSLDGVKGPTGSALVHFMLPESMPIMDRPSATVLFTANMVPSRLTTTPHYQSLRRAIDQIRSRLNADEIRRCRLGPDCSCSILRKIDRALCAYEARHPEIRS